MRVLIVEDDAAKADRLAQFVATSLPTPDITLARSFKSGLTALVENMFTVVLLDMTLPTFDILPGEDGGRPLAFGGKEILRQMKRRGIAAPVIITTQFEQFGSGPDVITLAQLSEELASEYPSIYVGTVYYHATQEKWRVDLEAALSAVIDREGGRDA